MDKQIIVAIVSLFISANLFAETCPSVQAIKSQHANGWKAYDSDDHTLLAGKRATNFKEHIEQFALAQFVANRHAMRCYYRDKNGSELEAYLQKDNLLPAVGHSYWYQVSGAMHCAAGANQCAFQSPVIAQTQLAKK
jgi:hypothetical protein